MLLAIVEDFDSNSRELACFHAPELFFAEKPEAVEQAKTLCRTCPVRVQCLAGALRRREPWGVWGASCLTGVWSSHASGRGDGRGRLRSPPDCSSVTVAQPKPRQTHPLGRFDVGIEGNHGGYHGIGQVGRMQVSPVITVGSHQQRPRPSRWGD
jgi:WhiB family transcriptional regulator, redox-sensing transcriptional regulator